ncbi:DUF262 domain-containing protein [Vibrio sp.]|nr:DUF262 domain-containing protein [Vibrio sp.]
MAIRSNQVQTISELLGRKLKIPTYQRPYKWLPKHVNQLIDDILNHRTKSCYRLGTVVLHQEKDDSSHFDIVDGQQRLLTLTLIYAVLDPNRKHISPTLLEREFTSSISIKNLKHNAQIIYERFVGLSESDKQSLLEFVLHKCELIEVTLDNLSEAFQFFDSQNARGKALAPYDLLKAYHLREMMDSSQQSERIHHVELWEQGVNPDDESVNLHTIMGEFLFRMRRWVDGDYGIQFSRHNIDVFKGINLETTHYAYAESMLALDYAVNSYNADPVRKWDKQLKSYPFQIDQTMINGQRFFEYIQHYIVIHKQLFNDQNGLLHKFIEGYAVNEMTWRKGDRYVRNLFMCAVMYYFDKFGSIELENAAKICYRWAYYLRLNLQRIGMESIDNYARGFDGTSLFRVIRKAIHPQQVLSFQPPVVEQVRFNNAKHVEHSIHSMIYGKPNEQ